MTEKNLTTLTAQWLQKQYPNVIYRFDLASDQKLSIGQATRNSRLHGKWSKGSPDLTIFEMKKGYGALFVELKVKSPFKKNGELRKDKHLESQNKFHKLLRGKGYKVEFANGFDEVREVVRGYFE